MHTDVLNVSVPLEFKNLQLSFFLKAPFGSKLNLYCNPGYGDYIDSGIPKHGGSAWKSGAVPFLLMFQPHENLDMGVCKAYPGKGA